MLIFGNPVSKSFSTRTSVNKTVEDFQNTLCSKFMPMFKGVYPYDLELWKLNTPIYISHLKDKLPELYQDMNKVASLMDTGFRLSSLFSSASLPAEHIHVIVWKPPQIVPNPSQSGIDSPGLVERRDMVAPRMMETVSKETQDPGPLVRLQSAGLDREGQLAALGMVNQLSVQTREKIPAIRAAIKRLPIDINFSNPTTFIEVPFPSPISVSEDRFPGIERDNVCYFTYMGRNGLKELENHVRNQLSQNKKNRVHFYGSAGSGKSYLLAIITLKLIQEGKRVVYIPEGSELIEDFERTLRSALGMAFYEDSKAYSEIDLACNVEALLSVAKRTPGDYLIVDQLDALEIRPGDKNPEAKRKAQERLARLVVLYPFLWSSSANEPSSQSFGLFKRGLTVSPLNGALNQEETKLWFQHYKDQLPKPELESEEQEIVDTLSGHVPLLLRPLLKFQGKKFNQLGFLHSEELNQVGMHITQFFNDKLQSLPNKNRRDQYLRLMGTFLRNGATLNTDKTLYDQRYFYIKDQHAYYTCGAAAEAMAVLLRDCDSNEFDPVMWYNAVKATNNPVVKGFIAEQICLKQISMNGLNAVQPELKTMKAISFDGDPYWASQINSKLSCRLYYPAQYNCKCIDGIILLLKFDPPKRKEAHFFPIQVTLSRVHKDSETDFYTGSLWPSWKSELENVGFAVKSTFVWIGKGASSSNLKRISSKRTRQTDIKLETQYLSRYVNISQVDSILADCL